MAGTAALYKACQQLFASYPLAARPVNSRGTIHSMVLLHRDGGDAKFFVLLHNCEEGKPFYSLCPWRGGNIMDIEEDSTDAVTDVIADILTRGVPIPQHGSLFGWRCGDAVHALIAVYAEDTPTCVEPSWTVMPLAEIPQADWPPFTEQVFFGHWFWKHYWVGSIVSLTNLIARIPDTVFLAETEAIIGWDCCIVARDIKSPEGYTLRRGRYVYFQALRAGQPVPSLEVLLGNTCKVDLAPWFRQLWATSAGAQQQLT